MQGVIKFSLAATGGLMLLCGWLLGCILFLATLPKISQTILGVFLGILTVATLVKLMSRVDPV